MTPTLHAGQPSQHTHIEAIRADQQGYLEIGAIAGDPDDIQHKRYIQRWFHLTGDNTADLLPLIRQLAAKYGNVYTSRVLYQEPRRDRALALPTRLLFLDDAPAGSYTYTVETSPKSMHAYIGPAHMTVDIPGKKYFPNLPCIVFGIRKPKKLISSTKNLERSLAS